MFRSERIRRVVLRCSNPSVSGVVCVRSERIRRVVLLKSFCFWGCVCLGRREYVGLCCSNPSVSGVVCLGRREYVELGCGVQILLFLGLCVFGSERIRRVVLLKSFCFWDCVCLGRREYVELCCSNPSVSGVVCV